MIAQGATREMTSAAGQVESGRLRIIGRGYGPERGEVSRLRLAISEVVTEFGVVRPRKYGVDEAVEAERLVLVKLAGDQPWGRHNTLEGDGQVDRGAGSQ